MIPTVSGSRKVGKVTGRESDGSTDLYEGTTHSFGVYWIKDGSKGEVRTRTL